MQHIDLNDFKEQFFELIDSVIQGDDLIITQNQRPVVKLVSVVKSKPQRQFGSAKGLIQISDDFNTPLDAFREYR
ncbi:MAG: type II toxin-antitoxin system prevent-host-death family antitoxin [Pseudomonadota bacterium]|nr:type II toxin-antitoxin system prevent-host-death family antitoxin [Pseudomonadota bacterium]